MYNQMNICKNSSEVNYSKVKCYMKNGSKYCISMFFQKNYNQLFLHHKQLNKTEWN